jgi:hypothetical protein
MGFSCSTWPAREARQCSDDPGPRTPNHNPITDGRLRVGGATDRQLGRHAGQTDVPGCDGERRVGFVVGTDYDEFGRTL